MQHFDPVHTPLESGITLLEASAGTGKTYSLVRIIARQIVENGLTIEQLLAVTFTRAATAEIKERIQSLLTEINQQLANPEQFPPNDIVQHWLARGEDFRQTARNRIALALANFDQAAIFTIDGFFQRLMRDCAFETGSLFTTELDPDEAPYLQTALQDYWRECVYPLDATRYSIFAKYVKFDEALKFITEANRYGDLLLASPYHNHPEELTAPLIKAWQGFISNINKYRNELFAFAENPPSEIKRNSNPFRSGGAEKLDSIICNILANPQLIGQLEDLANLTPTNLTDSKNLKKGKSLNLSTHPLLPIFEQIEQLNKLIEQQNQLLTSAYYGQILQFVRQRASQLKRDQQTQSYNDVTLQLARLLSTDSTAADTLKSAVNRRFHCVLIDEFQDTSPDQCKVFLKLFNNPTTSFFIIGDPKQSIYRFRGADVYSYIQASEQASRRLSLPTNFRSTPNLIHAVNTLFTQSDDPFVVDQKIQFAPVNWPQQSSNPLDDLSGEQAPALHLHPIDLIASGGKNSSESIQNSITHHIASSIVSLLRSTWEISAPNSKYSGPIKPGQIAILVRSAREGSQIHQQLTALNVPAVLGTRSSLLSSSEATELRDLLAGLASPNRNYLVRRALLTPALGCGEFIRDDNDDTTNQLLNHFQQIHQLWNQRGLMPAMLNLVEAFDIRTRLLGYSDGLRRVTNFFHLIELCDRIARDRKFSPTATLEWLHQAIQGATTDIEAEELELRISTDARAVMIITQHTSKGLQFPITFLYPTGKVPGSQSKPSLIYHDPNNNEKLTLAAEFPAEAAAINQRFKEENADIARLTYVAVTRAEVLCHFYLTPTSEKEDAIHPLTPCLNIPHSYETLASKSHQCIAVERIEIEPRLPEPLTLSERFTLNEDQLFGAKSALSHRPLDAIRLTQAHRSTSFSSLSRQPISQVRDVDAIPTNTHVERPEPLHPFWEHLRPGAALGLVFHELLEEIDFQVPPPADLIKQKLRKFAPWAQVPQPTQLDILSEQIKIYLTHLLEHPLGPTEPTNSSPSFCLADLTTTDRLNEANFLLPSSNLTPRALSQVLADSPPPAMPSDYPARLNQFTSSAIHGYLDGIIDLVFRHENKFYVLDWKTNLLNGYATDNLTQVMADHHYFLQAQLYAHALDRFLSQRLATSYQPENHFGGIIYVFLRAINPPQPGSGIYFDPTPPARLKALRQALAPRTTQSALQIH